MKVFVFSNAVVPNDSLPVKLLPKLKKSFPDIRFIHADPTENWWNGEKDVTIIDTVKGIDKVTLFDSLYHFQKQTLITPHDYDLLTDLLLLKKMGKITAVTILGIPQSEEIKVILDSVVPIINRLADKTHLDTSFY